MKESIAKSNIKVVGEVFVDFKGSAYVGGGLCDSDCDGYFCASVSFSKQLEIKLVATGEKTAGGEYNLNLEFEKLKIK